MSQDRKQGEHGEGNYEATRDYNAGVKDHMQHHDVEKEARDAAPKDPQEQREMDEAERIGKSKSKAGREKDMPDDNGKDAA
jgi:hypothetical protein